MSHPRHALYASLLPLALLAGASPARGAESYDNCIGFITGLPIILSTQGVWCMNADKAANLASGQAVTVAANNVIIDCNGFKLGNLAAPPSNSTIGIFANSRANVTIRNCNLRGYYTGIQLYGPGHVVEDTRVEASGYMGIDVSGDGSVIRRNTIIDTGTGVHLPYAAIHTGGVTDVMDNIINGVAPPASSNAGAIGIFVDATFSGRIEGNAIRGLLADGTGSPYGIFINNTAGSLSVSRNRVRNEGPAAGGGIQCAGAEPSLLVDNQAFGFAGGFPGCQDVSLNVSQ